jgi:hypothetical protein
MHLINDLADIAVITRPKLNGLGEHWGVWLPDKAVAHNTADQGEHIASFERFACGKPVRVVRMIPRHQAQQTMRRVMAEISKPSGYDQLKNNCETFVNRVTGEAPESRQVHGWLAVAVIGALCCMAST